MSPARRGLLAACLLALGLTGAAPPEVRPLRVPSDRIPRWFPAGTELKGMSTGGFDTLLRAARAGAARGAELGSPRLLRAVHSARWQDGVLTGRSELVIDPPRSFAGRLILAPWTPAVEPGAVLSDDAGRVFLKVEPAGRGEPVSAAVAWQLRARAGSAGRKFTLGLPGVEACELTLDLPEGLEPEGPPGLRRGPLPTGEAGRAGWSFAGKLGATDLLLVNPDGKDDPLGAARLWVEGPTRIEVGESTASWSLDWSVSGGPRAPRQLVVMLDPGLDPIGVTGPDVEDFQAEPASDGSTRLTVRLRRRSTASLVSVRAVTRAPSEGPWSVPSARPANAVWTGGTTTVRLDPSHVVESVRPLAGRRTAGPAADQTDDRRLTFEAVGPGPVAELTVRKPWADVSAEVRGVLVVSNTSPRLTCRMTWQVHRGRPHSLDFDLPPSWSADRVEIEGLDESVSWHPEVVPGGGVRIHVTSPSGDWSERSLVLNVAATAAVAGGRGPLTLPRIRPLGARVADEIWVARSESGVTLRPIQARGLAWIDPSDRPSVADPDSVRPALAWRWTTDDAEGRVERERSEAAPRGSVEMTATVSPARLAVEARVSVVSRDESVRSLTFGLSEPVSDPEAWRIEDETTGHPLPRKALDDKSRAVAGGLGRGPAWVVEFPQPQRGRVGVTIRHEGRWDGQGPIPLLLLPDSLRPRATALILASRDVRTSVETRDVRMLDPELAVTPTLAASTTGFESRPPVDPSAYRRAHAYAYEKPTARVELSTEALTPATPGGVIREALLTTVVDPRGGPGRRCLTLRIVPDRAVALEVGLPAGSTLERVRRDGQRVTPTMSDGRLSIPLGAAGTSRPPVVVTLDYRTAFSASADPTLVRPERPWLSLPCLALAWDVVSPEGWEVAGWGKALTPIDPASVRPGLLDRFVPGHAGLMPSWRWGRPKPREDVAAVMLADLDARLAATRPEGIGLGEWLTRWDAGHWPVVVDRVALDRAGLGPRSRVTPPRGEPGRPGSARAALKTLGLGVVPIGRVLLISTYNQVSEARATWEPTLAEAAAWGSDQSDRFESVSRWRDETTPRPSLTSGSPMGEGSSALRFAAPGWPESGAEVRLVDRRKQTAWASTVALAALTLGLALRGLSHASLTPMTAILAALGVLATALAPPWLAGPAAGLSVGAVGLAFFGLGESLPGLPGLLKRLRLPKAGFTVRRPRRRATGSSLTAPGLLAFAALGALAPWALAQVIPAAGIDAPILVFFPYDGPPDLSKAPDRVILRLSDYESLKTLADAAAKGPPPTLAATEAKHRVSMTGAGTVVVETGLTLNAEGRGRARWTFPVDGTRDLTATLDGIDLPVRVESGAKSASVLIDVSGENKTYNVALRRSLAARQADKVESIALAVNPVATARVEIDGHPAGLHAEVPNTRGPLGERDGGRGPAGLLGPVDRLDVRWSSAGPPVSAAAVGSVEGLYLWDATPAGDRVRARLTYRKTGGTDMVRVGLGPGVLVREASVPGAADQTLEGSPGRPEWVALFAPPLPDGATVVLDLWKPRPENAPTGPDVRSFPLVEPLGVERSAGTLAFRRPPDWLGRIAPAAGVDPVGEDAFFRAWGPLPEELLTLSGAIKLPSPLNRTAPPEVATGPPPARLRVVPSVQLTLAPGRIDLAVDAEVTETGNPVHEIDLSLPEDFRVVRVSADGLTDWSRPTSRTLRLRFDGAPSRQRKLRVQGWLGVVADPLAPTPTGLEVDVPWPSWGEQNERPGSLTVVSATRFQLLKAAGATVTSTEAQVATPATGSVFRSSYRISRPGEIGRLRWEAEPPRVTVQVRSQVTIDPDTACWVAVLRYDVSGGPLDAINLKLPTEWAKSASIWVAGASHKIITETSKDTTYWSIRPERPVWGSQRVVVRSSLPSPRGGLLSFPEINPLGWSGGVNTHLRIVNATRQPITVEGSSGLQAVASVAPDEELASEAVRARSTTSYRVIKDGWSLRVQKPGKPASEGSPVERVEMDCTLAADGSVLGVGRFDLGAGVGPFLGVECPDGLEPLWASVDGTPSPPLKAGPRRWEVPLSGDSVGRVDLVWHSAPVTDTTGERGIPLPVVSRARVPAVVTVRAPDGVEVVNPGGGLPASTAERVDIDNAGWLARETSGMVSGLDRSSPRDGERLVSFLVRFGLLLRQAQRASAWDPTLSADQVASRTTQARVAADRLRAKLAETVRNEALDDFETSARVQLGLIPQPPGTSIVPTPDPSILALVRPIGRPHAFLGSLGPVGPKPILVWSQSSGPDAADRRGFTALVAVVVVTLMIIWLITRRARRMRRLARFAFAALLFAVATVAGPWWCAAGFGLGVLGRIEARRNA